jgi:glutaredoxin
MSTATDQITVYWIPGCGNCTRLKGYLRDRGVEFVAVNVQDDMGAVEGMKNAGIATVPVVRMGDRYVPGFDLSIVDELLGLPSEAAARVLLIDELVERSAQLLEAAGRFALQIPQGNYHDATPTMDKFTKAFFTKDDGSPYTPHGTYKSLVDHVAGHGERFKHLALATDGIHDAKLGHGFGEPEGTTPMAEVVKLMNLTAQFIREWLDENPNCDISRLVNIGYGTDQTIQHFLQREVNSLAQHSRQLMEILERLGIQPDAPVGTDVYEGLLMPSGVWQ